VTTERPKTPKVVVAAIVQVSGRQGTYDSLLCSSESRSTCLPSTMTRNAKRLVLVPTCFLRRMIALSYPVPVSHLVVRLATDHVGGIRARVGNDENLACR
jgi:hypothetical protein